MREQLYHELSTFTPSWQDKPKPQVIEEIASFSMETNRVPDPYHFLVSPNGKLISPGTGSPIEASVEKSSNIGKLEYEAFLKIQNWAGNVDKGIALWISPPHASIYPESKIIISEIAKDGSSKIIFNRAVLPGLNKTECLKLAKNLSGKDYEPEELRSSPIILDLEQDEWLELLEKEIPNLQWRKIRNRTDVKEKQRALEKSKILYNQLFGHSKKSIRIDMERLMEAVLFAQRQNMFGGNGISCPPSPNSKTAFSFFSENAELFEGTFPCPNCHKPIPSGRGVTKCPHCGITKEEFGSKCD